MINDAELDKQIRAVKAEFDLGTQAAEGVLALYARQVDRPLTKAERGYIELIVAMIFMCKLPELRLYARVAYELSNRFAAESAKRLDPKDVEQIVERTRDFSGKATWNNHQ